MPMYEYRCRKCGKSVSIYQKSSRSQGFFFRLFGPSCPLCKSRRLSRVFSSFSVSSSGSTADSLNELSRLGPVNFVPQPSGPPPGGCPYAPKNGT